MNMSPARMSGLHEVPGYAYSTKLAAYTRNMAGLGDFLDYLTIADPGEPFDAGYPSTPDFEPPMALPAYPPSDLPISATGAFDWNKALQVGKDLVSGLTQAQMQKQVFDLNIERAKRGLAPISAASVSPSVGVSVGMQPDTKRVLVLTGAGIAIAYFAAQVLKRRR